MSVEVCFLPDNVTVQAEVGEPLLTVAARAGVTIPTGCLMGSCHACEVDVVETDRSICACITSVPPNLPRVTLNLYSDPSW